MTKPAPAQLTPAQRSNFWFLTAWGYAWWRSHSLSLLSGERFTLAREERLFLALARPGAGQRWLDIGTSSGFYAGVLARQGCRVDAADLSPAMLREAARREAAPLIRWHRMNAEHTGWAGEQYDGIVIGATLNETAHPAQMLQEAQRLLKPGGQLWLMYAAQRGGVGQKLLSGLGGLSFVEVAWLEQHLPALRLKHFARFGQVEFALLSKGSA